MIRIRTGATWRHDPRLAARSGPAEGALRAAALRAVVDALAIEVDGFDIAAGRAEAPLLPSLEALLRAVARVVGGATHATVPFRDGELELVIRRRGASALLTVVELGRTSRVLAHDVEVEVEALAAAALEASASFCRELALALPEAGPREARRLRAAERDLRRTEAAPAAAPRPRTTGAGRAGPAAAAPGAIACDVELEDDDGLLLAYEGGRPDLGSLLVPGRLVLRAAGGAEIAAFPGLPFLALRDLGAGAAAIVAAVRARERRLELRVARPGRGGTARVSLDLGQGTATSAAGAFPCPPLALARALADAALRFAHEVRRRNPLQAENAHLAELEAAAAERIAAADELSLGDVASPGEAAARAQAAPSLPRRPLGPGRLRRLAFRPTFRIDLGAPAPGGLALAGGLVVACGAAGSAAVERASGRVAWRGPGATLAAALPGALLVARDGALEALATRSGRPLWSRPLPGGAPSGAFALVHGPYVVAERGALTALDPGSGRTLWRFEPPAVAALHAAPFGGVAAVGTDSGLVLGLDAAGRVAWRLRAPGPVLRAPAPALGSCLALCAAGPGAVALALDPARGARRFEARLDFVPSAGPVAWGRRAALGGAVGGDPIVGALEPDGRVAWSVAPPLAGPPALAAAGGLLLGRDAAGAVVALDREGRTRWSRPAPAGVPPPGALPPAVARGTALVAGDGIAALDAATGELVAAIPGIAPVRLAVDASLGVAALDADGIAAGWRLATHLSVV
jgi:outer membrane protein assembly factor BamB